MRLAKSQSAIKGSACDLLAPRGRKENVARSLFPVVAPLKDSILAHSLLCYKFTNIKPANIHRQILTDTNKRYKRKILVVTCF